MFEAAELGHVVDKQEFEKAEIELRTELLEVQRALAEQKFQTIVIVSGVEGAGKSAVVNRLTEWLDARGVRVSAWWDETDEERERPRYWKFWRDMPKRGSIGIFFGSWYTQPMIHRVMEGGKRAALEAELERINAMERMLTDDGAVVVKLWLHLSQKAQEKEFKKKKKNSSSRKPSPWEKRFAKRYDEFVGVSETVVRHTDTGNAPWHIIDSENSRYRDLMTGRILLGALKRRLEAQPVPAQGARATLVEEPGPRKTVLDSIDLESKLDAEEYEKRLEKAQARLNAASWKAAEAGRSVAAVFEGWDAAGKGGAIRRITRAVDARLANVISTAAPTDEERAQHYLWRFWRHVPRAGFWTLYDRSWYGRVLVERVEGFARQDEWERAYQEINEFEHQMTARGVVLCKFWLHISNDEQLQRFQAREATDYKRYKITDEDWRNRDKWTAYEDAVDEMVRRTSTHYAPWTLIGANDKRSARVQVVETLADAVEKALEE